MDIVLTWLNRLNTYYMLPIAALHHVPIQEDKKLSVWDNS